MTALEAMHTASVRHAGDRALCCVAAVAASLPPGSLLAAAYREFTALPLPARIRARRSPLGSARYVARVLRLRRVPADGAGDAWGMARARPDGEPSFCRRIAGGWWGRIEQGLVRIHVSRVICAWEIR